MSAALEDDPLATAVAAARPARRKRSRRQKPRPGKSQD